MTSSIMDELLYNIFCEGIRPSEHPDAANFSDEVKRKMDRNWEARQAERAAQGPEVNPTQRTERRTSVRGPNLPQINRNPNSKPSAENRRVNVPTTKDQRAVEFFRKSVISKPKVNKEHYSSDTLGEDKDHEHSMARSELSAILNAAKRLRKKMNGEGNVEAWVQSKITRAADYLDSAADYIDSGEMKVNEERMTQSDVEKEKKLKNMGGMEGASIGEKKLKIAKALAKIGKTNSITMYDDAAKVHNAFRAERKRNRGLRRGLRIRTQLAKPNKQGDVMLRSYQAADFNLWVGGLLAEGYDLSEFTVDDLYEAYEVLLEELIAEEMDEHEPLFKSPYAQGVIYSNQIEEEIEQTPYDFWKSFIFESENMDEENEDDEIEEEISFDTPYDAWKSYFSEKYIKEEDGQDEEGGSSFTTNITPQQIAQERIR